MVLKLALSAPVIAVASPSAIRWVTRYLFVLWHVDWFLWAIMSVDGQLYLIWACLHCNSAWVNHISELEQWNNSVACIGETTAKAAKKLGLRNVYYPANPGLEG